MGFNWLPVYGFKGDLIFKRNTEHAGYICSSDHAIQSAEKQIQNEPTRTLFSRVTFIRITNRQITALLYARKCVSISNENYKCPLKILDLVIA